MSTAHDIPTMNTQCALIYDNYHVRGEISIVDDLSRFGAHLNTPTQRGHGHISRREKVLCNGQSGIHCRAVTCVEKFLALKNTAVTDNSRTRF